MTYVVLDHQPTLDHWHVGVSSRNGGMTVRSFTEGGEQGLAKAKLFAESLARHTGAELLPAGETKATSDSAAREGVIQAPTMGAKASIRKTTVRPEGPGGLTSVGILKDTHDGIHPKLEVREPETGALLANLNELNTKPSEMRKKFEASARDVRTSIERMGLLIDELERIGVRPFDHLASTGGNWRKDDELLLHVTTHPLKPDGHYHVAFVGGEHRDDNSWTWFENPSAAAQHILDHVGKESP